MHGNEGQWRKKKEEGRTGKERENEGRGLSDRVLLFFKDAVSL